MSDDYLWDRSGPPNPEIARLEQLLRQFGHNDDVRLKPDVHEVGQKLNLAKDSQSRPAMKPNVQQRRASWVRDALAAAAVFALLTGGWWFGRRPAQSGWDVALFDAPADASSARALARRELGVGGWLETGAAERARISVADIGRVDLEPRTRVRLIHTTAGDHRLELARGTLHATISAPPGQFFVQSPSALVVDLGCVYTLMIDAEGQGRLLVNLGWVALQSHGRESLIPAGFLAITEPDRGPGTPRHIDTSPEVRAALDRIDFGNAAQDLVTAIDLVLQAASERDEVTLWHLLTRVPLGERNRVFDRLAMFVPPPPGVTREAIGAGRPEMLDRWWDAMGLGTIEFWRTWRLPAS